MKAARVLPLVAILAGCAHADYGQLADSTTTAVALSREGFAEGNPLLSGMSWPWIAATKIVITQAVKLTPPVVCEPGLTGLALGGFGAALWNIAVMAGSGPAALPLIIVGGGLLWEPFAADAKATCGDPWAWPWET